ncbi:MAG: hypothetical protein ACI7YS_07965 [Flavobacterium sp.]
MKKIILSAVMLVAFSFSSKAQEIGVRWGDVAFNDFGIDAVFSSGKFNRIHADVSFGNHGVGADVLFDFLVKPLGGSGLNWYAGVGPSVNIDDDFWLGASGELGLEYKFQGAPIVIGADWRPTIWIIEDTHWNGGGFGVNLRYVIK